MCPKKSSRWCPTPEQLMILEDMYRGGIKTPKAAQIQAITAHLSQYGKIEGKNVFYWFQNHKARDRQKLRSKLVMPKQNPNQNNVPHLQFVHPQLFYYVPVQIQLQVESVNDSSQMMIYTMKPNPVADGKCENHEPTIKTDNHDWFMVLEAGPANRPLKTLELFPTTSSGGLKMECVTALENSSSSTTN